MPSKKVKYTQKIQFFPRSANDLLKDDSNESQNIIVPMEPEHFKYGIYFNDGYDYMSHLISREDFDDPSVDLKELVNQSREKCKMLPSQVMKSAAVIKEFEAEEDFNCTEGETVLEKLQKVAKDEIDEDILNALDSDAELSELEDDFVDMADTVNEKPIIKGDKDIFSQFFGNNFGGDDEGDDDLGDFVNNIRQPINDISKQMYLGEGFNDSMKYQMPEDLSSKRSISSKALLHALEKYKSEEEHKVELEPIDKSGVFYQGLDKGETEFDEEEVNKAVDAWVFREPKVITSNVMAIDKKPSKHQPKIITVPSARKRQRDNMEIEETSESEESTSNMSYTDVNQFHVPRPPKETAEEKRERKKAIKSAKHARKQEKKSSIKF